MEESIKVLFIASSNSHNSEITPFIKAQARSLRDLGVSVNEFPITEKGIKGYLKAAKKIRKHLKNNDYDIIHAHYTLSGWATVLSFPKKPIILSLMGTDAYGEFVAPGKIRFTSRYLILLTKLIQPFVSKIICKSAHIASFVYLKKKSVVIPNGIQLDRFRVSDTCFRSELGLKTNKKYVLFLGNKEIIRKNYKLIVAAINLLQDKNINLIAPYPITHSDVIKYLNSVDCLAVPSLMEGSPNIVKEAMACNCPVVATDVGDVKWLFGKESGHFLTSFDPKDVSAKISMVLKFAKEKGRTNGRQKITKLNLDSGSVAKKIINIYQEVIKNEK